MAENCCDCAYVQGTLFDALESIVLYDGHSGWLKELRDELARLGDDEYFNMPNNIKWRSEEHAIMMLLVGMFGDWGTSIRSGWISDKTGCIEFVERLCKEAWEAEEDDDDVR